jgi:hypothetical protein
MARPIFVIGIHKSGSSLVRSLLDGHPDLAVLPREPHFFERSGLRVTYPLRPAEPRSLNDDQFAAAVTTALELEAVDTNPYSDSPAWHGYSPSIFNARWSPTPGSSLPDRYARYLETLWAAAELGPRPARFVDKSTEYVEFVPTLSAWFPDARFVHVLRDPYANLVAVRRYHAKVGRRPDLGASARAIRMSFRAAATYATSVPGYLTVRYEDLVASPETQMRAVASHLELAYLPSLLAPTIGGVPWQGNSGDEVRSTEIRRAPAVAWRDELHAIDIRTINAAMRSDSFCGYGRLSAAEAPHGWTSRLAGESVMGWLVNRARDMRGGLRS